MHFIVECSSLDSPCNHCVSLAGDISLTFNHGCTLVEQAAAEFGAYCLFTKDLGLSSHSKVIVLALNSEIIMTSYFLEWGMCEVMVSL